MGTCDDVAVTASGPVWGPSRTEGAGKLGTEGGSDLDLPVAALAAATCIHVGSTTGGAGGGGGSLMCSKWEWHTMARNKTKSNVSLPVKVKVQPAVHASQMTGLSMSSKGLMSSEGPKLGQRAPLGVLRW